MTKGNLKNSGFFKFLLDFVPVILFFLVYKAGSDKDLIKATTVLTAATIISLIIAKKVGVVIDKINLYSSIGVIFFGLLTIIFKSETFIKIKITIIYSILAVVFFVSIKKKPLAKEMMSSAFEMGDKHWKKVTANFGFFFTVMAALNEIIRRLSTDTWVNFKAIGLPILLVLFIVSQVVFMVKNGKPVLKK